MAEMGWALDEDYYDIVLMRCDRFSWTKFLPKFACVVREIDSTAILVDLRCFIFAHRRLSPSITVQYCMISLYRTLGSR